MEPVVFVINLDRAQARLAAVDLQLRQFGWTFERVRAWDARTIGADALARLAPDPWSSYQARTITPGEICCLASHREVWRLIVERRLPWALVLEDDARLRPRVPAALSIIEQQSFFDCVKLEGIADKPRKTTGVRIVSGPPDIYLMETVSAGAAAYHLSQAGARKLLRITEAMNRETDFFIRQYGLTDLVVGEVRPFLASQDRSGSFIGASRLHAQRASGWDYLARRLIRFRASIMRRHRFRQLAAGRPRTRVTTYGSSTSEIGQEL